MSSIHSVSLRAPVAALIAITLTLATSIGGCDAGNEGDRCNPYESHDECDDGLVCSGPGTSHPLPGHCVENYCCPHDPSTSAIPYCNGTDDTCPAPDAGPAATGDDSGDATPE
jgi:hypothetical protein